MSIDGPLIVAIWGLVSAGMLAPASQKVFVSDTQEITWNTEKPGAAYLAVNTPNTKLFTSFPEGRTIDLGGVKLAIGKTRLNRATVSLVSRRHVAGRRRRPGPPRVRLRHSHDQHRRVA